MKVEGELHKTELRVIIKLFIMHESFSRENVQDQLLHGEKTHSLTHRFYTTSIKRHEGNKCKQYEAGEEIHAQMIELLG